MPKKKLGPVVQIKRAVPQILQKCASCHQKPVSDLPGLPFENLDELVQLMKENNEIRNRILAPDLEMPPAAPLNHQEQREFKEFLLELLRR